MAPAAPPACAAGRRAIQGRLEHGETMRLLFINANATPSITDLILREARRLVPPEVELLGATAPFGAAYVASRAAYAIAGHAALDALAAHGAGVDAVVLACFGDPGLFALQEVSPVPVVGMAEAAIQDAVARGGRFAIVTGGAAWGPMLTEFVATLGLADRLASVRTVAPSGADIARDPDAAIASLAAACDDAHADGAEIVILGGAGLAGLKPRIAERTKARLLDGLECAVAHALAQAGSLARPQKHPRVLGRPRIQSVGLSAELAALLP